MDRAASNPRKTARLVQRARKGDVVAFGRLYDEYAGRVYAFVRTRTKSAHDAEDVTATVFLKAWESIRSYDDRGLPFSAWLFRIARNAAIDEHRRSARIPIPIEESAADRAIEAPDEAIIAKVDAEKLRQAVRELTEEQASVIALRFWWDLSLRETAEALGKNENAVKALQHRATRTLARILQEDDTNEHR
jgi:RNA polymerase sigma-70 factor (ECF subfamily)